MFNTGSVVRLFGGSVRPVHADEYGIVIGVPHDAPSACGAYVLFANNRCIHWFRDTELLALEPCNSDAHNDDGSVPAEIFDELVTLYGNLNDECRLGPAPKFDPHVCRPCAPNTALPDALASWTEAKGTLRRAERELRAHSVQAMDKFALGDAVRIALPLMVTMRKSAARRGGSVVVIGEMRELRDSLGLVSGIDANKGLLEITVGPGTSRWLLACGVELAAANPKRPRAAADE